MRTYLKHIEIEAQMETDRKRMRDQGRKRVSERGREREVRASQRVER